MFLYHSLDRFSGIKCTLKIAHKMAMFIEYSRQYLLVVAGLYNVYAQKLFAGNFSLHYYLGDES